MRLLLEAFGFFSTLVVIYLAFAFMAAANDQLWFSWVVS
jgi:hypothetical protein